MTGKDMMAINANDLAHYLALAKQHGPLILGGTAAVATTIPLLHWLATRARHGCNTDAHWASRRALRQAYLLAKHGIVLGRIGSQIVRYNGRGHVFVVASTQSGKSRSLVTTTLLGLLPQTSVIIHDPKGELYATTAPYRRTISRVLHVAPCSSVTDHYNPLDAIRLGEDEEVADCQLLGQILANPDGKDVADENENHWLQLTAMALEGLLPYGLRTGKAQHLPGLHALVTQPAEQLQAMFTDMAASPHAQIAKVGSMFSLMDEKQFASVYTSLLRALNLYGDPQIARMVEKSDFCLEDLRQGPQPVSLYLSIPFSHLERTRGLTRLLFRQWLSHVTDVPQDWGKRGWHKVLVMGEEFPSLRRLNIAADLMNQGAGLGVQLCLIAPSMNAIEDIWGTRHNFLDNSHVQCFFGITDERVAERVSKRLGTHTITEERVSTQGGRRSVLRSTRKEPLMDSSAITHMLPNDVLVLARNAQVIVQQSPWNEHEPWKSRGVSV
jgi:type IV secretion system protein VirD4